MFTSSHSIVVLAIVVLDLLVGGLRNRLPLPPGPPVLIARLALSLSRRLDRPERGPNALLVRGVLVVAVLGGMALALGLIAEAVVQAIPYGFLLDGVILWSCLRIYRPLDRLQEGARRYKTEADAAPYGRAALEQTAVSFVHFVVAPVFWYLLAGLPGLLAAVTGWGLERSAEGRSPAFGLAAHLCERVLEWVPSRIAEAILAIAATVVPRGHPLLALSQAWRNTAAGDLGPIAALAGGLGVTLAGPIPVDGGRPWVGAGSARIERRDVTRAIWLYSAALLVLVALLTLLALRPD